ncbi:hypothetical protein [Halomonas colorata]|nr:hypothetical protein [Halomonas colorata]
MSSAVMIDTLAGASRTSNSLAVAVTVTAGSSVTTPSEDCA